MLGVAGDLFAGLICAFGRKKIRKRVVVRGATTRLQRFGDQEDLKVKAIRSFLERAAPRAALFGPVGRQVLQCEKLLDPVKASIRELRVAFEEQLTNSSDGLYEVLSAHVPKYLDEQAKMTELLASDRMPGGIIDDFRLAQVPVIAALDKMAKDPKATWKENSETPISLLEEQLELARGPLQKDLMQRKVALLAQLTVGPWTKPQQDHHGPQGQPCLCLLAGLSHCFSTSWAAIASWMASLASH